MKKIIILLLISIISIFNIGNSTKAWGWTIYEFTWTIEYGNCYDFLIKNNLTKPDNKLKYKKCFYIEAEMKHYFEDNRIIKKNLILMDSNNINKTDKNWNYLWIFFDKEKNDFFKKNIWKKVIIECDYDRMFSKKGKSIKQGNIIKTQMIYVDDFYLNTFTKIFNLYPFGWKPKKLSLSKDKDNKDILLNMIFSDLEVKKINNLIWKQYTKKELFNLKYLNLAWKDIEKIPEWIFKLKKLNSLSLNSNKIKNIQQNIQELKELEILDFSDNKIKNIPVWICSLKKLKIIRLNINQIESIPECFFNLKQLKVLNLNNNNIKKISKNISLLENLEEFLFMWNSNLSIPEWIYKLKKLKELLIGGKYVKKINDEIVNLKELEIISLVYTDLKNLSTVFVTSSNNAKYKKCQDNITIKWKRLCIDSTWKKIKITFKKNIEIRELSFREMELVVITINKYIIKLNNKITNKEVKIEKLNNILKKIEIAKKKSPIYQKLFNYISHLINIKITLYK